MNTVEMLRRIEVDGLNRREAYLDLGALRVRSPAVFVTDSIIAHCSNVQNGLAHKLNEHCNIILKSLMEKRVIVEMYYRSVDKLSAVEVDALRIYDLLESIDDSYHLQMLLIINVEGNAKDSDIVDSAVKASNILEENSINAHVIALSFSPSLDPKMAARISVELADILGARFALTISVPYVAHRQFGSFIRELEMLVHGSLEVAGVVVDFRGSYLPSKNSLKGISSARSLLSSDSGGLVAINARGSPRGRIAWLALAPYFGLSAIGLNHIYIPYSHLDGTTSYRVPNKQLLYLVECKECDWLEARILTYSRILRAYEMYERGELDNLMDVNVRRELTMWLQELKRVEMRGRQGSLDQWLQ